MVLKWGSKRRPHFSHLPKKLGATRKCSGGGEDLKHNLAKEGLAQYLSQLGPLRFFSHCQLCAANGSGVGVATPEENSRDRAPPAEWRCSRYCRVGAQ